MRTAQTPSAGRDQDGAERVAADGEGHRGAGAEVR